MIFLKGSGLNDDVYKGSQAPIKKFLLDTEKELKSQEDAMRQVFNVMTIDGWAAKFTSMTGKGKFSNVGENGAYVRTTQQQGYSKQIEPATWKMDFAVSREMIDDGKMLDIRAMASDFMSSYYQTRVELAAAVMNNGTATTMTVDGITYDISCNDALALFTTGHTYKTSGGTWSNYYNAGFSYDNLCRVEELMQKWTVDAGATTKFAGIQPDTIVIPNNARIKRQVADALWTKGDERPGTSDHSFNYQAGRWNIVTWNNLTNPSGITSGYDCWYLMDSRYNALEGMTFVERTPLEVKSYIDDATDANVWAGYCRFSAAPVSPRAIAFCCAGAGTSIAES